MSSLEILSLVVTIVCLVSFCLAFTFLFRHYYNTEMERVLSGREDQLLLADIIYESRKDGDKKAKIVSVVLKVLSYLLVGILLLFFVFTIISRVNNGALFFGNRAYLVIATGSMSEKNTSNSYLFDSNLMMEYDMDNQFDAYSLIEIERYQSQDDVRLYDVVAYLSDDNDIIVHRIIEIHEGGYVTKGDANNAVDTGSTYTGYLTYEKILGKYTGTNVGGIGSFVIFLQSNAGIITIVCIVYCFGMFDFFASRHDRAIEVRKEYLLAKIPLDMDDEDALEESEPVFREILSYKGVEYLLDESEIPKKEKKSDKEESDEIDLTGLKKNDDVETVEKKEDECQESEDAR